MLLRKPTPEPYLSTPSPDHSPPLSTVFTECEAGSDGDYDMMSGEEPLSSRPMSFAPSELHPLGPYCPRMPTLTEILSNTAPPPWTLSAFTAYLSQNHCLENLEFVKDAERYRQRYAVLQHEMSDMLDPLNDEAEDAEPLGRLWARMVNSYLERETPREINIPSDVRDQLLSYAAADADPPPPEVLDPAIKVVYDLMNESVLMTFIHELSPRKPPSFIQEWDDGAADDRPALARQSLERGGNNDRLSRSLSGHRAGVDRASPPAGDKELATSGKSTVSSLARSVTASGRSTSSRRDGRTLPATVHTASTYSGSDPAVFSDDALSGGSQVPSPMTPPTTPPIGEWDSATTSPRSFNGRGDNAWRKMMGRLGSKRKPSGRSERPERSDPDAMRLG